MNDLAVGTFLAEAVFVVDFGVFIGYLKRYCLQQNYTKIEFSRTRFL